MPRSKKYISTIAANVSPGPVEEQSSLVIMLPPNSQGHAKIDLRPWIGKGIDDWVTASAATARFLVQSGNYSITTIVTHYKNGFVHFLQFLIDGTLHFPPRKPDDLKTFDLNRFIAQKKRLFPGTTTAKNIYSGLKTILRAMHEYGLLNQNPTDIFPPNPFGNGGTGGGEIPLSHSELKRLATALKTDLVSIHQENFPGPDSQAIAVLMLLVAMRTGLNTTPLIEMDRDCLKEHPFMPNMMMLNTFKRRGRGAQSQAVRQTALHDVMVPVRMDCVGVLQAALKSTEKLISSAPQEIRDRVWLYRHGQPGRSATVSCFKPSTAAAAFRAIMARHELRKDDGSLMRITPAILRKTMENRLWDLTDGDLPTVAEAMGHSPKVADNHYLCMNEETKSNAAQFIGTVFTDALRGKNITVTPSGNCKDSLFGDFAPKNGQSHCEQFTHCLGCPSYAIVGTVADLYRLFSFQIFLSYEIDCFEGSEWADWRAHHRQMIALIDDFTSDHFSAELIAQAKKEALISPHPFWSIKMRRLRIEKDVT
jgi:hypothetical protein